MYITIRYDDCCYIDAIGENVIQLSNKKLKQIPNVFAGYLFEEAPYIKEGEEYILRSDIDGIYVNRDTDKLVIPNSIFEIVKPIFKEWQAAKFKSDVRAILESEFDYKDRFADIVKRLDWIERAVLAILSQDTERINRYKGYADTVLSLVENNQYITRADLYGDENEPLLFTMLIERQMQTIAHVKEYLDNLDSLNNDDILINLMEQ